jgi:hypothetical protein
VPASSRPYSGARDASTDDCQSPGCPRGICCSRHEPTCNGSPCEFSTPRPEAACIAYDLHVLTLIEDHGLVEDTDPETLRQAAFQMLDARAACRSGDVRRALALYSSIPLGHVPMTPFYRILMR